MFLKKLMSQDSSCFLGISHKHWELPHHFILGPGSDSVSIILRQSWRQKKTETRWILQRSLKTFIYLFIFFKSSGSREVKGEGASRFVLAVASYGEGPESAAALTLKHRSSLWLSSGLGPVPDLVGMATALQHVGPVKSVFTLWQCDLLAHSPSVTSQIWSTV